MNSVDRLVGCWAGFEKSWANRWQCHHTAYCNALWEKTYSLNGCQNHVCSHQIMVATVAALFLYQKSITHDFWAGIVSEVTDGLLSWIHCQVIQTFSLYIQDMTYVYNETWYTWIHFKGVSALADVTLMTLVSSRPPTAQYTLSCFIINF